MSFSAIIRYFASVLFLVIGTNSAYSQFRLMNSPPLNGGNGLSAVTFNIEAHASIFLDTMWVPLYGTGPFSVLNTSWFPWIRHATPRSMVTFLWKLNRNA